MNRQKLQMHGEVVGWLENKLARGQFGKLNNTRIQKTQNRANVNCATRNSRWTFQRWCLPI